MTLRELGTKIDKGFHKLSQGILDQDLLSFGGVIMILVVILIFYVIFIDE